MLDEDLAQMYSVETKRLNEQVKRNGGRFPQDFMFQLTQQEYEILKSQNATSSWGGRRKPPYAFTEHGVLMLSSILNSDTAIEVNIRIMRIFTKIRETVLTNKDILLKLEQLEGRMIKQDNRLQKHEDEIQMIFSALKQLLNPPKEPRKRVGFKTQGNDQEV